MRATKDWNLLCPVRFKYDVPPHAKFEAIKTMSSPETKRGRSSSPHHGLKPVVPTKPEELNILPEYVGPDAIHIYSDDELPFFGTDPTGGHWWLIQRPDGSYAKLPMDD